MATDWRDRIVIDPGIHHGVPCIKGTRVPVSVLVGSIADGNGELIGQGRHIVPGSGVFQKEIDMLLPRDKAFRKDCLSFTDQKGKRCREHLIETGDLIIRLVKHGKRGANVVGPLAHRL